MSKQEEIKEGTYLVINNHTRGKLTPSERRTLRDALLEYEDSQGVVIKVDRELPDLVIPRFIKRGIITDDDLLEYAKATEVLNRMEYIKAGCGFFEPLIKEEI